MPHRVTINGQLAFKHDEGDASGYFFTFDGIQVDSTLDIPRKVHVFVPRDYIHDTRCYPVIYMNDGHTSFWPGESSPHSWEVSSTLSDLYQKQMIRPLIVVAIHPIDRSYEYLHVNNGGLRGYACYLARMKQFIDAGFRTMSDRSMTTIIGSSHGGLASFYTGVANGGSFGNVAALSPSFWVEGAQDLRDSLLVADLRAGLQSDNPVRPRLWIDWGMLRSGGYHNSWIEENAANRAKEMLELLQRDFGYVLGTDIFTYEDQIGGHDERAWAFRLRLILRQFYPPVVDGPETQACDLGSHHLVRK